MEVTLKQAALVSVNDGTIIIKKNCTADRAMIKLGNCFQTKKEAEKYLDKFKEVFKR